MNQICRGQDTADPIFDNNSMIYISISNISHVKCAHINTTHKVTKWFQMDIFVLIALNKALCGAVDGITVWMITLIREYRAGA